MVYLQVFSPSHDILPPPFNVTDLIVLSSDSKSLYIKGKNQNQKLKLKKLEFNSCCVKAKHADICLIGIVREFTIKLIEGLLRNLLFS
jgi:hypothetical protein